MQTHSQGCWECVVGTAHETLPTRVAFWGSFGKADWLCRKQLLQVDQTHQFAPAAGGLLGACLNLCLNVLVHAAAGHFDRCFTAC